MKSLIIAANWKSNKTLDEDDLFVSKFINSYKANDLKEIIICPSFTGISFISSKLKGNYGKISIGAQNVSSFSQGSFTGEVNAMQLKDFCSYCIVGHSERRINFSEDLSIINDKIKNLLEAEIAPIICVSSLDQLDGILSSINGKSIIAYEPLSAIGSKDPANPIEVNKFSREIKEKFDVKVLYGGSVNSENVSDFTNQDSIDGVLVGGESLDPISFLKIIENA
jgi:triosephosphate isomerase